MKENIDIAKRLRQLRESKMPIKSMATTSELMGLSTNALRRYERGERDPSSTALVKIADYYNVSVDYILGRKNY